MGKAERNKRQQAAAKAVNQARGARGSSIQTGTVIGVVVVLVLGVAVIGGILLNRGDGSIALPESPAGVTADYPVQVTDDGLVQAGKDSAPVTVDIYEDFLCPVCGRLYDESHKQLSKALAGGKLQANFHMLNTLDKASDPEGYSGDAANAALCAADQGKFQPYYNTLFENQPSEGGAGYTKDQLIELGRMVGISGDQFGRCVRNDRYGDKIDQNVQRADKRLTPLSQDGRWGTPSVVYKDENGKDRKVQALGNPNWVQQLVNTVGKKG